MEKVGEIKILYSDVSHLIIKALNDKGFRLISLREDGDGWIHEIYKQSK